MKIGDRVKILHSPYVNPSLQPGKTGRVVAVEDDLYNIVMDDSHPDSFGDLDWPFDAQELEVINV
jgi:hypothetical protein